MSKYQPLWEQIRAEGAESLLLTFERIEQILGFPIDHSFLTCKKELAVYGYQVVRISMKNQTVLVARSGE